MITVVSGPPCGGKSTFVRNTSKPGDIVVDMDRIALALTTDGVGHHDYSPEVRQVARAARRAAVQEAMRVGQLSRVDVWIIHTDPSPEWKRRYRIVNAHVEVVDPGKDVCLSRLASRPDSNHSLVKKVLDDYYNKR